MLKVLYIKWVLKQCRHLCALCEFRKDNLCFEEMSKYTWKELFDWKRKGYHDGY